MADPRISYQQGALSPADRQKQQVQGQEVEPKKENWVDRLNNTLGIGSCWEDRLFNMSVHMDPPDNVQVDKKKGAN